MTPLRATYRLQLHEKCGFDWARDLLSYFAGLGVSHLYLSPVTVAQPGSMHGYDAVDPTRINPELGGEEGFARLARAAAEHGLGIVLDIVPNHLRIGRHNPYWMDVLKHGPRAGCAHIFDIDWHRGPIHLALLDGDVETCLCERRLFLARQADDEWCMHFRREVFPLRPGSLEQLGNDPEHIAGDPAALRALLALQYWRLADGHTAGAQINYRRFFNIQTLAGVRVEDPAVFDWMHALPLRLAREGLIDGVRVDHIDGLTGPTGYCERLRAALPQHCSIHLEKILGRGEALRDWPVEGTTGYDSLATINGVFAEPQGYETLRRHAIRRGTAEENAWTETFTAKRRLIATIFAAELKALTTLFLQAAPLDADDNDVEDSLADFAAAFPFYRSFFTAAGGSAEDTALIGQTYAALQNAGRAGKATAAFAHLFDGAAANEAVAQFRIRFQQLTAPTVAKGYEDTELYRRVILLSQNEVGGDVANPVYSPAQFHAAIAARQKQWPRTLVPLATHDTKRGADSRARLNALSEFAEEWIAATARWRAMNKGLHLAGAPDALEEEFLYQTLLSCWPIERERLEPVLRKSLREAKRHTNWSRPDKAFEEDVLGFAARLLDDGQAQDFRGGFSQFARPVAAAGKRLSMNQLALQLTLPGVPDIYRGTELWDYSLVDPDNRRRVDWDKRVKLLNGPASAIPDEGAEKLQLLKALLAFRKAHPSLFAQGDYTPVETGTGDVLAFTRSHGGLRLLTIVGLRGRPDKSHIALASALAGRWNRTQDDGEAELSTSFICSNEPLILWRAA